jgi:hypothetical protein
VIPDISQEQLAVLPNVTRTIADDGRYKTLLSKLELAIPIRKGEGTWDENSEKYEYPWKGERRPVRSNQMSILNDQHKLLDECLGNLHCAPAHMIILRFEKSGLRTMMKWRPIFS